MDAYQKGVDWVNNGRLIKAVGLFLRGDDFLEMSLEPVAIHEVGLQDGLEFVRGVLDTVAKAAESMTAKGENAEQ